MALTLTSPPYWNFVDYGCEGGVGRESAYGEYLESLGRALSAVYEKTMPGGTLVVNASNMKSRRKVEGRVFVYPIVSDIIGLAGRSGFIFFDEIVWVKSELNRTDGLGGRPLFGSYPYPCRPKILDSIFENVMVFVKPGRRPRVAPEVKERSGIGKDDWWRFTRGVWRIPPDRDSRHPATFPVELAERVVRLYSFWGDLVLDPFAGSRTTLVAAERHGRRSLGFEIAPAYRDAVAARMGRWLGSRPLAEAGAGG